MDNLDLAIAKLPTIEQDAARKDGIRRIHVQASNFGPDGVQELALLWWEWEEEHWDELHHGVSMNFLTTPTPEIIPNGDMTQETRDIAIKFVDELVALNILPAAPPDMTISNNTPLFVIPKDNQPGEWRSIANAKEGG